MSRGAPNRSPWTTWRGRVAAGAAAAAVLLLSAWIGVRLWVDAETVERHLSGLLSGPEREAAVTVGRADARLWRRSVRIDDISVRLSASDRDASRAVTFAAGEVGIEGVSVLSLVLGDGLDAERIRLERPSVVVSRPGPESGAPGVDEPGTSDEASPDPSGVGARPGGGVPALSVGRLDVEGGRLALRAPREETTPGWEDEYLAEGLSLRLVDVAMGGSASEDGGRIRLGAGGEVRADRIRRLLPGGMHGVEARGFGASLEGDSVRIDSLRLLPLPDEEGFVRRLRHRKDRLHVVAGGIRGHGVDVARLVRHSGLRARRIDVGSLVIAVHSDKRLRPRPGAPPPVMPPELLRDASVPIAVDTVRVEDGRVEYSERTAAATRPGRVGFEEVDATFLNVANDTSRVGPDSPTVLRTTARLFGAGRLRAEFRFPVASRGLDFTFSGELDEMDLRSFNDMFVPVDGIRVQGGDLERLVFEARVRGGTATGSVRGRYRDLDLEKVDPESRGQSLSDVVESLVMDAEIRADNPPSDDEEARTGTIQYRRAARDPFFYFLWASLRSGLLSLVGA